MTDRNTYDEYAEEYSAMVSQIDIDRDPILSVFLETVGDVDGLQALDAGCGEGLISRILADRGAQVSAIDICAPLVEKAKDQDQAESIDYAVMDLSTVQPDLENRFDLVTANYVLNDVPDHVGFISTIGRACRAGGRAVLSINNPYSAVRRSKASCYFAIGERTVYQGLSKVGIEVYYYHRTLEEYVEVFRKSGFLLSALRDIRPTPDNQSLELWNEVPALMVLEFLKTHP